MADCLKVTPRDKIYNQFIELIVTLIRNITKIPGHNLYIKSLDIFSKEKLLEAIVYISQDFSDPSIKKLTLSLVETFYHLMNGINVDETFMSEAQKKEKIANLLKSRQREVDLRKSSLSSRHSHFNGNYATKRSVGDSWKIVHRHDQVDRGNRIKNATSKPLSRKNHLAEEVEQMDMQLLRKMRDFIEDFMLHAFSPLLKSFFEEFQHNKINMIDLDFISIFNIHATILKSWRLRKTNLKDPIDFGAIVAGFQTSFFEILNAIFKQEQSKASKKDFSYSLFITCLESLKEIFKVILLLRVSESIQDRRNSQIITEIILHQEVTSYLLQGFIVTPDNYPKQIESLLILMNDFMNILEVQCKGKILTALKQRRKTKRRVKKEEDDPVSESDDSDDDDNVLIEKKYNYESEVAAFSDDPIIAKILRLLDSENIENISDEALDAICSFFTRNSKVIKTDWMLYRIEYLNCFQKLFDFPSFRVSFHFNSET